MLDMGPYYLTALVSLLGPAVSVAAITGRAFEERVVTSEPRRGERISVEVNTHQIGTIRFTGGAAASISMSFDVWKTDQPRLEIHGTEGSLSCPDPNNFGGSVKLYRPGMEDWEIRRTGHLPYRDNSRGLGLSEMVSAIGEKRPHRASGELAVHVLDTMLAFDRSSAEGRQIELTSTCNQPAVIQV